MKRVLHCSHEASYSFLFLLVKVRRTIQEWYLPPATPPKGLDDFICTSVSQPHAKTWVDQSRGLPFECKTMLLAGTASINQGLDSESWVNNDNSSLPTARLCW